MKPRIRKQGHEWAVTRPAFGFGKPSTTVYTSWRSALRSVDASAGIVPLHTDIAAQPHDGLSAVPSWDWRWSTRQLPGGRSP